MTDQLYTVEEMAKLMSVTETTIRRWVKSGDLAHYRLGREYRLSEAQVDSFLGRRLVTGPDTTVKTASHAASMPHQPKKRSPRRVQTVVAQRR